MVKGHKEIIKFFHFNDRTKMDMARPVPELDSIAQLTDPKVIALFDGMVKEVLDNDNGETALLGRRLIEDILLPQFPEMRQKSSDVYFRFQRMAGMLKFCNLSTYPMQEIVELIKNYFADVLRTNLPIFNKFQNVLNANDDIYLGGRIAESLTHAMQDCKQTVGDSWILSAEGKTVGSTLGNWLTDYIQFSLTHGEHTTGSLERVEYLKLNQNVRKLPEQQREVLSKLFRIYDWLRYGGEAEEETKQENIAGLPYLESEKFELPEEVLRPEQGAQPSSYAKASEDLRPVVPVPKNVPEQREMGEVRASGIRNYELGIKEKAQERDAGLQKPALAAEKRTDWANKTDIFEPTDRVNIQDILKNRERGEESTAGLKMGGGGGNGNNKYNNNNQNKSNPSSYILNPLLEKKPVPQNITLSNSAKASSDKQPPLTTRGGGDKTQEIDRKLEELKKKLNN